MSRRLLNLLTTLSLVLWAAVAGAWCWTRENEAIAWRSRGGTFSHVSIFQAGVRLARVRYPEADQAGGGWATGSHQRPCPARAVHWALLTSEGWGGVRSERGAAVIVHGPGATAPLPASGWLITWPPLLLASGSLPAAWGLARLRRVALGRRARARARANLCPSCGYDLRATPGRCPECGGLAPV